MKFPINVYNSYYFNCLDSTIMAVASWLNMDWELMCLNSWNYSFGRIEFESILESGKYSIVKGEPESLNILEEYHGIKISKHSADNFDELKTAIIRELESGFPVSIFIDSYCCQWFKPKYKTIHSSHSCLIIGVDEKDNKFWISDAQMATDGAELPFDEYCQSFSEYITYRPTDIKKEIDWKSILSTSMSKLKNNSYNAFDDIRNFEKKIVDFIPCYSKWQNSGVHEEFLICSQGIKAFSHVLKYISRKYKIEELVTLSERMDVCGGRWMSIYGMFTKTFFLKSNTEMLNRISNKILEAADEDEKLYVDIIDLINKSSELPVQSSSKKDIHDELINSYYFVDIDKFLNNTGFYSKNKQNELIEFSYGGRYYLQDNLPKEKIWECKNMKFSFPDINSKVYDNVSCVGQTIKVDEDVYSYIILLAASEIGDHVDNIYIHYEDGYIEKSLINFSTWRSSRPVFGEQIVWQGISHSQVEKNKKMPPAPAYIYGLLNELHYGKSIEKIQLPFCPNIHIFGITLGK